MSYAVKELFKTLQGEGLQAGRAAVFCRFAGCNLWSGLERDRAAAVCSFCDTDFVGIDGDGGGRFATATDLAAEIARVWSSGRDHRLVVFTGGEPLLQLDAALVDAVHDEGFRIAIETNGTLAVPDAVDWICVSPKAGAELVQRTGHELKLVFPQSDAQPEAFADLAFTHHFLQPMDGLLRKQHTERTIAYCMAHPRWRLSLQTHKLLGIR